MNQRLEKAGKWLFGITLAGGIFFSTSAVELLPFIVGIVFLAALAGFPGFRRQIHWRRMFLFSAIAMLAILGMYYLTILYSTGKIADVCLLAVWPLVDEDTRVGVPLEYWLLFWVMKGLFSGFIIESFSALGKQPEVRRIEACVRRDSEAEGDVPPFGLAGILSMACMAVIFLATQPLAGVCPQLYDWIIPALFIIGPIAIAFLVLHRSSWQCGRPAPLRRIAILCRVIAIFGVVSFIVLLMLLAVGFLAALEAPRGQYGSP